VARSDGGESGESVSFAETWGLIDYSPTEIAEQLTLIDAVCIVFGYILFARFYIIESLATDNSNDFEHFNYF
jgi:hypothetical protein